jgi:hypothetical protein
MGLMLFIFWMISTLIGIAIIIPIIFIITKIRGGILTHVSIMISILAVAIVTGVFFLLVMLLG